MKLQNLEIVNMNDNQLSQDIPNFQDIHSLKQLRLEHNSLEGVIDIGSSFLGMRRRRICDLKLQYLSADCSDDSVICFCCTECFSSV